MVLKNFIPFALLVLISCKKDYTCKCTYTLKSVDSTFTEDFKLPANRAHQAVRQCIGRYAERYHADSVQGICKLFTDH